MAFDIALSDAAREIIDELASSPSHASKYKKVLKALKHLEVVGPSHPGFHTHKFDSLRSDVGDVWQSYIENKTPGAWRMWWVYGPASGQITVVSLGKHP